MSLVTLTNSDTVNETVGAVNALIAYVESLEMQYQMNIGDWNMDANNSKTITLPMEISYKKITNVSGFVRSDDDVEYRFFGSRNSDASAAPKATPSGSGLILWRDAADMTGANWNATSYNRGVIIIHYIA